MFTSSICLAQQSAPTPTEDAEKVFTEEVRIPVFAADEKGNFDPSLEREDVLVLEDDVPQEVRSVRRVPASVMLLLGTGGELNRAVRTSLTRDIALHVVSRLREGDAVALLTFDTNVEGLQKWTTDRERVNDALRTRLKSGRGARLSKAIIQAASYFEHQPVGNRHLVIITDGVEVPGRLGYKEALRALDGADSPEARAQAAEAARQLNAAQATVHVISYGTLGRKVSKEEDEKRAKSETVGAVQSRADMARAGHDPTKPYGSAGNSGPSINTGIRFDPQMRKLRKAYEREMARGERRLTALAEETGGRIWLPASTEEMIAQGGAVAREIGSQYVITYRPKRPLASAPPNEYRRIRIAPRRIGLTLRARRGYVVASMR